MKKLLVALPIFLLLSILIIFSIKGDVGNPLAFQEGFDTRLGGPYESSGSNSRYALIKSIIEDKSFFLNTELAKFASPDLVSYNGKFTTLFTPGVSFAAIPFYYIGRFIGSPQLLTFFSSGAYALINILLIYLISRQFKVSRLFSLISGIIFVFSTTGLAYTNTLTQHHLSTLLILASILNATAKRNILNNLILGVLIGAGVLVDIPNVFMMAPVGIYVFLKHFFLINENEKTILKVNPFFIAIIVGLIPLAVLFAWYNNKTVGSYTKLAQSIGRTDFFASEETKKLIIDSGKNKEARSLLPFETRAQLNGLYILLVSNERGLFYYNPIIIFGIFGLVLVYKNKVNNDLVVLITATVLVNILIYSMFGDPWGGWSYGPRYMIPTIALLSTGIGYALTRTGKNPFIAVLFILLLTYSVAVNVLGSTTTNLLPPKIEAMNFPKPIPYTYIYNYKLALDNESGILIYNLFLKNLINVKTYIYFYSALILTVIISLFGAGLIFQERKSNG